MSLKDLELRNQYRSDRHNLLADFYIPCLERSLTYDRAVGFFSSTSLAAAAKGVSALIRVGGRMRLIASPHLSSEDADAIAKGLKQRNEVITTILLHELEQLDRLAGDRLSYLAWLLSKELLEIKLAVHQDPYERGIYHEKLGIFRDVNDSTVVFTGSANESAGGLIDNFECVDVFRSWRTGDDERIAEKIEDFQRLWENQTPKLEILEFPEAARRSLLRLCPAHFSPIEQIGIKSREPQGSYVASSSETPDTSTLYPVTPTWLTLRPYQQQAISNWFANKGRGTLKMATGSGKTITALAIAAELYQKIQLQALIIVCPFRHLVSQWARECQKFGLKPILAYENVRTWQGHLSTQLYNIGSGNQAFLTVITTNATLMSQGFQSQLAFFPDKTLIIGDEAHNLGAKQLEKSFPRRVGLRLALSATPERHFDESGTEALFEYFGQVLEPEFTLKDAIAQGALVHYLYYPILVELTEPEVEIYAELTTKIGRVLAVHGMDDDNDVLTALLMERTRLVGAEKLRQSKVNLKLAVSTRGYTVLLADTTAKFRALVDGLRQRGELPDDMKQQFVQDLLSRQRCICGTELVEGTSPHEHVRAYLDKAGLADVEETVIRMSAQVEAIDQQIPKFWEDVDQEQAHINQLKGSLSRIETALDDIRGQLKNSPSEDIRKLESRLEEVEAKIQQLTLQQGENQQKIIDREAEIEKLSRQIEKLQMNEERQALAQRRVAATEDAIARLKQVLNNMDTVFRIELEKRVQEFFSQIVVVPYLPKLTEKYELTLVEATTGQESPVAASTGENQVLSLSFIGAIIDRVRQWSKDKSRMLMGPDSGTFPIVMDSPFGSLDELYRREVGRSLPLLANQLVVLVSKTQWRGEVAEEMATYIGKEYVLAYNSSKPNVQPDQIELGGISYPLVQQSPNEFDYTEILEVDLGGKL